MSSPAHTTLTPTPWQTTRQTARVLRRTPLAWQLDSTDIDDPERETHTRFPDFAAFALLAFPGLALHGYPASELLVGVLVLTAASRTPTAARSATPLVLGPALVVGWLLATSLEHHVIDQRRLLHLGLWAAIAYALGTGRIHLRSAALGAACGLVTAVGLVLVRVAPDDYPGRLSGYFGDPNGAGYAITVLGAVALAVGLTEAPRLRLALLAVVPLAVVLTYSRTTLLALSFSIVWLLVGRRLGRVSGLAVLGTMAYVVTHIPDQVRLFGPFSDRTGSDDLRVRLITQEHLDVGRSPLFGGGAGTAQVRLSDDIFYYHSSYLALQREGGLVAICLFAGVVVLIALCLLRQPAAARNLWVECALICLMISAVNLGEVLLEIPAAVALGAAVHHLRSTRSTSEAETATLAVVGP